MFITLDNVIFYIDLDVEKNLIERVHTTQYKNNININIFLYFIIK